jgi:hypothetical protein
VRKLPLAIVALGLLTSSAEAQQAIVTPATMASVPIVGTVATASVLVSGIAGKSIYVTSVDLVPVATSVVTFSQGTGAACAGGTTANLTGALTFAAGQVYSKGAGVGVVWVLLPGNNLCITIAAAAAPGSLAYAQF